jgi:hypothetical protein
MKLFLPDGLSPLQSLLTPGPNVVALRRAVIFCEIPFLSRSRRQYCPLRSPGFALSVSSSLYRVV